MQIQQFVHDLRSAKFAIEEKSADDWAKQGANLRAVLGWMQTGEAGDVGAPGIARIANEIDGEYWLEDQTPISND